MRRNYTLVGIKPYLAGLVLCHCALFLPGCVVEGPQETEGGDPAIGNESNDGIDPTDGDNPADEGGVDDVATDDTTPGGDGGSSDNGDGQVDPEPSPDPVDGPVEEDAGDVGDVGDANCLTVALANSESSFTCSNGPCGEIRWQNDCGESVVVILLDSTREKVLHLMGVTVDGIATAFIDPLDWSAEMAYGVVNGTDTISCGAAPACSVSDLIERGFLDLSQLVGIAVN